MRGNTGTTDHDHQQADDDRAQRRRHQNDASEPSPTCRICHGGGRVVRSCQCRGTCAYVHLQCLQAWVNHRQSSGMSMRDATTCELCLQPFAHRLQCRPVAAFLVSRGAWRAWAHIAYLTFCARRVWGAGASILVGMLSRCDRAQHGQTLLTSLIGGGSSGGDGGSGSGDAIPNNAGVTGGGGGGGSVVTTASAAAAVGSPRTRTTAMLALHYWLLLVLDARLLFAVFRKWRDMNTTVVVCARDGEGEEEGEQETDEAGADGGDGVASADGRVV